MGTYYQFDYGYTCYATIFSNVYRGQGTTVFCGVQRILSFRVGTYIKLIQTMIIRDLHVNGTKG